jgi:hypothetical protein
MPATGKVYIYNTTNQAVKVELNDTDLDGRIQGNSGSDGRYLPGSSPDAVVPRSDASSTTDAAFATNNVLEIKFSGTSNKYPAVNIDPGSFSIDIDLVLYIFYNHIVLVSPVNNVIIYNGGPASN